MSDMHITGWKKKHLIAKHLQILAYKNLNKLSKQDKEEHLCSEQHCLVCSLLKNNNNNDKKSSLMPQLFNSKRILPNK